MKCNGVNAAVTVVAGVYEVLVVAFPELKAPTVWVIVAPSPTTKLDKVKLLDVSVTTADVS